MLFWLNSWGANPAEKTPEADVIATHPPTWTRRSSYSSSIEREVFEAVYVRLRDWRCCRPLGMSSGLCSRCLSEQVFTATERCLLVTQLGHSPLGHATRPKDFPYSELPFRAAHAQLIGAYHLSSISQLWSSNRRTRRV